ncbi:MAG: hypothetical protein IJL02_03725 [Methanobrevibacter sp.]|uniref:hypothetical protein n=1 Tax=Methanobrevibacter sp. TaxID=66852 RepID=UPI0025CFE949|nr:hypothetical protein [Methanobrevibacter sp.]MBQ6098953.1 hypothetical protein [Methanobrevibacter sp.]
MSYVVLGCDINNGNDSNFQNTVAKALEKQGHTVEKLTIGPNYFASYSYSSKAKGKIGVFLIAAGLTALCDLYDGNTSFKYAYFGIRGDIGNGIGSMNDFKTKGIHKDHHGDCISKSCNPFNGKTFPQINEITKAKCQAVYGGTPEEMANNIIKAMGGQTDSSSSNGSSAGSTIKDSLKKAVSGWDGDVEIRVEGDTVYVNKIKDPTTTKLVVNEFENVQFDSVTVTDVNPQTTNKITCNYKGYELTLQDDLLIKRFGENAETVEVDEFVKNYNDAVSFLQRAWNKIRRDDGRQVELKVKGDSKWKTGLWVRVYLPSFYIDDYMYITRMSADEDGSTPWITGLTLVDYPPSFGTFEEETSTEEETTEEDSETTTDEEATS